VENSYLDNYQKQEKIVWQPQPGSQEMLVNCPITLIGYGGARGGGKTDGVLGKFAIAQEQMGEDFNAIFFRKELPQADDLIERAKQIYLPLRAHWQDQKKQFRFPGGGRLRFRPLANDDDAEKFQGQNLSHAAIEEAGNYANPSPIWKLFGALRGKGGGQVILTFNPGGVGHHWLKVMFIKPWPKGFKILKKELPNGSTFDYIYIPSRVHDNQILLAKDPQYIDRLHMVGSPELVRAWLEGDFEIHEGSYFPEFSSKHIVAPFNVPKHWPRYIGYDWGFHSPFAAVWGAVSSGKDDHGNEVPYPKGAIIIYRELWGKGINNADQAEKIASLSLNENPICVADPSIFNNQGGPSINDQLNSVFAKYKHPGFKQADNDRISGWAQIRQRLVGNPPLLYIFASCPYLLETLPSLSIDKKKPEDADTTGPDHACLTGDTPVVTNYGIRPIKELCGDFKVKVLSHDRKFHEAAGQLTRKQATCFKVLFTDGSTVTCTPDHKFMLPDGFYKQIHLLNTGDVIRSVIYESNNNFKQNSGIQRNQVLPLRILLFIAKRGHTWFKAIAQKGMGIFQRQNSQKDACAPQRWESSQQSNREFRIAGLQDSLKPTHDPRQAGSSESGASTVCPSESYFMAQVRRGQEVAFGDGQTISAIYSNGDNSLRILQKGISGKEACSVEIKILPSKLQNGSETKTIESITNCEAPQDVYCLNVPSTRNFVLGNGVVSHNCDALRYLCKERLIDAAWEKPADTFNRGRVKLQAYVDMIRAASKRTSI